MTQLPKWQKLQQHWIDFEPPALAQSIAFGRFDRAGDVSCIPFRCLKSIHGKHCLRFITKCTSRVSSRLWANWRNLFTFNKLTDLIGTDSSFFVPTTLLLSRSERRPGVSQQGQTKRIRLKWQGHICCWLQSGPTVNPFFIQNTQFCVSHEHRDRCWP